MYVVRTAATKNQRATTVHANRFVYCSAELHFEVTQLQAPELHFGDIDEQIQEAVQGINDEEKDTWR